MMIEWVVVYCRCWLYFVDKLEWDDVWLVGQVVSTVASPATQFISNLSNSYYLILVKSCTKFAICLTYCHFSQPKVLLWNPGREAWWSMILLSSGATATIKIKEDCINQIIIDPNALIKDQLFLNTGPNIVLTFAGSNATTDRRIANKTQV